MLHRSIPSPVSNSIKLGPVEVRYYAVFILLGIVLTIIVGSVRYKKAEGDVSELYDAAIFVVPAGVIGGRLYHVVTTPELYFGSRGHILDAFKIWQGGMGIWGALLFGVAAAYTYFKIKPRSISFSLFADALAPGILLAQSVGRWGNWFNKELFGSPTTLPWAVRIPLSYRPKEFTNFTTFHPTFLYESIWCALAAIAIFYIPAVKRLRPGSTFILYIALYCAGRLWIEALRIDRSHLILGLRLNIWVALLCLLTSSAVIVVRQSVSLRNLKI